MTTTNKPRRCLFCSRFVKAGVTRCTRCDGRSERCKAEREATRPAVVVSCSAAEWATFVAPSAAVSWARRSVMGGLLVAVFTAFACR